MSCILCCAQDLLPWKAFITTHLDVDTVSVENMSVKRSYCLLRLLLIFHVLSTDIQPVLTLYGHIKTAEQWTSTQQYCD